MSTATTSAAIDGAPTIEALRRQRLPRGWFARDTRVVARALLGCALVHGGKAGIIVETEAYLGPADRASHARFGPTARNAVMFGASGTSYVYLCYGVHEMFNIVARGRGAAGAVLVRAVAPLVGLPDDDAVGRGPGKLTRALGLGRGQHGLALDGDRLFVAAWRPLRGAAIERTPRIGVDYAGPWAARPFRFVVAGDPAVSGARGGRAAAPGARDGRRWRA
jgi:DNA-3-methyladenine glycosylase